ncbi:MAG: cytochrome c oxidase subunit II [Ardenticatenaceae bacterium]|nr:cytochrome c oxidase subunit II [Ardenticatenaceae bacterium]MCB9444284.1 cytochrome c oxidase subunit II [Ardenticatenaceae bacterium]
MSKRNHYIAVTALVIVTSFILYFILRMIYTLPIAASAEARPIDQMFTGHFIAIAFLFSLIMVFMLYSAVVFRRRPGDEEDGPHIHSNTTLEIMWTIIPTFVVVGFGVWGTITLNGLVSAKDNEMVVKVTGQQWSWSFEYPEQEGLTSPKLVLPVDRTIVLQMESKDVLHSFWVPEFRVKQDLVPGRTTTLRITPTKLGDYKLRCAEICGLSHANMMADVQVVTTAGFNSWVEERLQAPVYADMTPEERGAIWYSAPPGGQYAACSGCHSIDGSVMAGPTWQGIYGHEVQLTDGTAVTADDEYIRNSILNPNAQIVAGFQPNIMPQNFGDTFAAIEAEIQASEGIQIDMIADIIAYMQTLQE